MTRSLLILVTTALLSGAAACGSTTGGTGSKSTSSSSTSATSAAATPTVSAPTQDYTKADQDRDNDIGAPNDDKTNNMVLNHGRAASPADKQAVEALVKRYYAVAVAGDGAKACSMIVSGLAEAVAEDYGHGSAGPSYLSSGTTCSAVMRLLFKHFHTALTAAVPALTVTRMRVVGRHGFVIMSFGALERQLAVVREGPTWRVGALLDSELP